MTRLHTFVERWHASRRWTINRVPLPLLTNSHELALAAVMALLGLALLVQEVRPGSVVSQVPQWMVTVWSVMLLAGGVTTVWGVFRSRLRIEWTGQVLIGWGCAFYSLAVSQYAGATEGGVVVAVFAMLSIVSHWRAFKLIMSPYVQARLARDSTFAALQARGRLGGNFDDR